MFAFFAPVIFFARESFFFCFFAYSVAVPSVLPDSMYSTQQYLRGLLLLLYLWPPAAVCTYDLQHSLLWLLLLLFIVNRLLIVCHAVLLLCHSYHPVHAFEWAQCSTCLKFSSCACEDQFHFSSAFRFFFFPSSDLVHRAPIITAVAVRLFAPDRGSCVLASCCGLPLVLFQWSILQFSLRIRRTVAAYFSFFSGMFFFNQSQPWILWSKQTLFLPIRQSIKNKKYKNETKKWQQHVWYVRVLRVHIHIHIYSTYTLWYNYNITQCCCM